MSNVRILIKDKIEFKISGEDRLLKISLKTDINPELLPFVEAYARQFYETFCGLAKSDFKELRGKIEIGKIEYNDIKSDLMVMIPHDENGTYRFTKQSGETDKFPRKLAYAIASLESHMQLIENNPDCDDKYIRGASIYLGMFKDAKKAMKFAA